MVQFGKVELNTQNQSLKLAIMT